MKRTNKLRCPIEKRDFPSVCGGHRALGEGRGGEQGIWVLIPRKSEGLGLWGLGPGALRPERVVVWGAGVGMGVDYGLVNSVD